MLLWLGLLLWWRGAIKAVLVLLLLLLLLLLRCLLQHALLHQARA
jgi:hypothetical protein